MTHITSWWKSAFGEIYLRVFASATHRQTEKEVAFIIKKLSLRKGARILDVPCGEGRHSIALAKHGLNVTGVDYSPTLLTAAKQRAKESNVSVSFIKKDMRFLKFRNRFDVVLVLGNSFGYFDDIENENVIANLSASLKKTGCLMLELSNLVGMLKTAKIKERCAKEIKWSGGVAKIQEESTFNPLQLTKTLRWTISREDKNEVITARLRFYTFPEIHSMLTRHKLSVVKTYGSFDAKPYGFETPKLIVIAQK